MDDKDIFFYLLLAMFLLALTGAVVNLFKYYKHSGTGKVLLINSTAGKAKAFFTISSIIGIILYLNYDNLF